MIPEGVSEEAMVEQKSMSLFCANQCSRHTLKEAPASGQKEKIQANLPASSLAWGP